MSPLCVELIDKCSEETQILKYKAALAEHSCRDLEEVKLSKFIIKVKVLPVTLPHSDTSF